jgi:hypothetical protein
MQSITPQDAINVDEDELDNEVDNEVDDEVDNEVNDKEGEIEEYIDYSGLSTIVHSIKGAI